MTESAFSDLYGDILRRCHLEEYVTREFCHAFYILYERLVAFNQTTNITAITAPEEVILKHFADSLRIAEMIPPKALLLDVGCGGGFPTLPLAIVRKDLTVTALDSTAKKLEFVKAVSAELGLSVNTVTGRAEELGKLPQYREKFDAVTARAVAALPVLSEWCLPFLKVGGCFIAMKGQSGEEELKNAQNAISVLGGGQIRVDTIPLLNVSRVNIRVLKVKCTPPAYPRNNGAIMKKPL